jgi:hypothetical protein
MTTPSHDLAVRSAKISELTPHPENARHGDVPRIMTSLRKLGQYRPIVVNRGSMTGRENEILAGHHLVQAATELGWDQVAITMVDVDDETAKRIMLADNRTSDLATYDDRLLVELLGSLSDLDGTGYDPGDLEALESLFKDHAWEVNDKDLQDTLDEADKDGWPVIKVKIAPDLHVRFLEVPGADDGERVAALIQEWDENHE